MRTLFHSRNKIFTKMSDEDSSEPLMKKSKRGRPRNIDEKVIFNGLLKFKDRMSPNGDGKLVSKKDNVWKDIAKEVNYVKTEAALYAYVSCNQDDVRRKLWTHFADSDESSDESDNGPEKSVVVDELLDNSVLSCNADEGGEAITFAINVPAMQFDKLVETRVTFLRNKQPRRVKKFLKGEWQLFITEKIWANTRLKCGWNFKYHHLSTDCSSGVIKGSCKCGSELNCIIERNDGVVTISCSTVIPEGERHCGKRYVRGTSRVQLGEKLRGKSAHVVRAQMADEMMEDDDAEPPHLPTSPTMRTIKSQRRRQEFLHQNPIIALDILGSTTMKDEISWIGYNPFFVHYATKHQRTLYEKIPTREHTTLAIDATGSIFFPISRDHGSKSGPLFLYIGVLGSSSKPYTVTQMISEIHTTGAIQFWLEQWIERWGSVSPKEVVSDCSSALLGALVRAFSKHDTVNEYADEFFADEYTTPYCYIRIDIAHIMKIFATSLRDVRREVARFYMVGIGKLTLCRKEEEAERLVRALLTISRSPNCGNSSGSKISACEKQKRFVEQLITTNVMEEIGLDDDYNDQIESVDLADPRSQAEPSQWREWGRKIDVSAKKEINNSPGTEINAHWLPKFADQLIERLKWLPLWSCITRDSHGYGRCPASSAIVEAEFGIIKNLVLKDADLPMRPDEFIALHKSYVDGRSKLKEADIEVERQHSERRKTRGSKDDASNTESIMEGSDSHEAGNLPHFDSDGSQNQASRFSSFESVPAHSSSIEKSTTEPRCPACENGDMPGGAHRCMICDEAVHVFEPCSRAIEGSEEGYGEKRVCSICAQSANSQKLLESQAAENGGNEVALHERKNKRLARTRSAAGPLPTLKPTPKPKPLQKAKRPSKDDEGGEKTNGKVTPVAQLTEKSTTETTCPACENGDMPGGAHRCMICDEAVHVFEPCSLPIEGIEEGYGQKRVCSTCARKPNSQKLLESRAVENWGNQVVLHEKKSRRLALKKLSQKDKRPSKTDDGGKETKGKVTPVAQSRGKYLQATYNADQFLLTGKLTSVPILKSGSEMKLKPIRKGDKKFDFTNTCAFDSLFQLTLTASFDSELFFTNSVKSNAGHDPFMKMVCDVHNRKITVASYRQRANILSDLFAPAGHPELDCILIKCDCTVATICRKVYKNVPCFEETSTCSADCPQRVSCYPLLTMNLSALTSSAYNESITDEICVDRIRGCPNDECRGVVTTALKTTAEHLILEVISEDEAETVRLEEIPQRLKLSFMDNEFQLAGIVNFDSSGIPRALRNSEKATEILGHYTAFCFRNGRWYQFDKKCKPRKGSHKVSPQLVVYTL